MNYIQKFKKFFLIPLLLTILGFVINQTCGGFICFIAGHGFPIPYYYSREFFLPFFLVDFAFFIIVYFVILKLILFLKKIFK